MLKRIEVEGAEMYLWVLENVCPMVAVVGPDPESEYEVDGVRLAEASTMYLWVDSMAAGEALVASLPEKLTWADLSEKGFAFG